VAFIIAGILLVAGATICLMMTRKPIQTVSQISKAAEFKKFQRLIASLPN
jgi:hypothetical protein